jgi:hypothetical protein
MVAPNGKLPTLLTRDKSDVMSLRTSAEMLRWVVLLSGLFVLVSCWTQRTSTRLPDLSNQLSEVSSAIDSLEETKAGAEKRLGRFTQLQKDFFEHPQWLSRDVDFPVDAFKYIAMTCLNFAPELAEPSPPVQSVAEDYGLGCAPLSLLYLSKVLSDQPKVARANFVARLQEIDSMRGLGLEIEERLSKLTPFLLRGRSYVAETRSQMRQMELDFRRRESDFSASASATGEVKERFAEYRRRIDDLEAGLDDLEGRKNVWTKRMSAELESLYSGLSLMRTRADGVDLGSDL